MAATLFFYLTAGMTLLVILLGIVAVVAVVMKSDFPWGRFLDAVTIGIIVLFIAAFVLAWLRR